jgi:hypothetical protein
MIDHLTPREIAMQRYKQHHEWMEEILSSPYQMSQIIPVDLGLGLKGELEALTKDVLDAPSGADVITTGVSIPARKGDLEPSAKENFQKRVEQAMALQRADMDRQHKRHERRMEKLLHSGERFRSWEARLKDAGQTDSIAQSADGNDAADNPGEATTRTNPSSGSIGNESAETIVKEIEAEMKKSIVETREVVCRARGGLTDNPTVIGGPPLGFVYEKTRPAGPLVDDVVEEDGDGDVEMGNDAGGLTDQFSGAPPAAAVSAATTASMPQPAQAAQQHQPQPQTSNIATTAPAASTTSTPAVTNPSVANPAIPVPADMQVDIEMAGVPSDLTHNPPPPASGPASADPETAAESGDWVVVTPPAVPAQLTTSAATTVPTTAEAAAAVTVAAALPAAPSAETIAAAAAAMPDLADVLDAANASFSLDLADDSAFGDALLGTGSGSAGAGADGGGNGGGGGAGAA